MTTLPAPATDALAAKVRGFYGILAPMKNLPLWCLLGLSLSAPALGAPLVLDAEQWAVPRGGEVILGMAPISKAMRQLDQQRGSSLLIRYPGGDEGSLWANELRAWLVALGLSSRRIELVPGSHSAQTIELEVRVPLDARGNDS